MYGVGVEHVGRDLLKEKESILENVKKMEIVEQNRNELEHTIQSIHNHQQSIVTATNGTATAAPIDMPFYVNVDGTMSIDNGNPSCNNSNLHNDNEDDSDN